MSIRLLARVVAGIGLCAAAIAASAANGPYTGLVVFGDSLSDSGNNALVLSNGGTQPLPPLNISSDAVYSRIPSAAGTYTNGLVWTQYLAQSLGLPLAPSLAGGNNYAYAGAQTSVDGNDLPGVLPGFPFSMRTQVNTFLGTHAAADPNALYIVAGGGNNVRVLLDAGSPPTTPEQLGALAHAVASGYAADMLGMVQDLKAAGAQHILVLNTPNLGLTPYATFSGMSTPASILSAAMNAELHTALTPIGGVVTFDMYGFLSTAVLASEAGMTPFTNWTNACAADGATNACSTSLFWDGIHPTTLGHQQLAAAVLATAVPEPESLSLLLAGLAVVVLRARRRAAVQQG
ncbi:MAG TPA: SGNH/GDSL hydrolase family protein [Roseateles sp.]